MGGGFEPTGESDGGVGGDGGVNEGGGSFGCSAGGGSAPVWPAIVIGLALLASRRRR